MQSSSHKSKKNHDIWFYDVRMIEITSFYD
jgi:hypothetical protein